MNYSRFKIMLCSLLMLLLAIGSAAAEELVYVDAPSKLTVINRAQSPAADSTRLERLDVAVYPQLSAQAARHGRYTTGMAILFRTDSPVISARWTTGNVSSSRNTTPILQSGMDMYIKENGKWTLAGVAVPSYHKTEHNSAIVSDMDGQMHECLLYMPMFNSVASLEIGVKPGSVIEAIPNPFTKKIVVVGSSITHGASASRPGLAYPALLQRALNVEVANLGFSGICRLDPFFADIVADTEADLFLFDTFSNSDANTINTRLRPFVDKIRAAHPDTPLVFMQTLQRETGNFDLKKRKVNLDQREAARAGIKQLIDDGYKNIYFIDPAMVLDSENGGTVDGTHLTDASFRMMVDKILPVIRKRLK